MCTPIGLKTHPVAEGWRTPKLGTNDPRGSWCTVVLLRHRGRLHNIMTLRVWPWTTSRSTVPWSLNALNRCRSRCVGRSDSGFRGKQLALLQRVRTDSTNSLSHAAACLCCGWHSRLHRVAVPARSGSIQLYNFPLCHLRRGSCFELPGSPLPFCVLRHFSNAEHQGNGEKQSAQSYHHCTQC